MIIVRLLLFAFLLYFVFQETGWVTTIVFGLLFIHTEIVVFTYGQLVSVIESLRERVS